ncbi:MAG: hypothetical protein IT323_16240, partial [Anaerolineae bacterium]|nr:hypothetical protein [Anaerolineae bacterium]
CGAYIRRAISLCRTLGNRRLLSGALVTLGNWAVESGDVAAACDHYREALHIAREVAYRQNVIHTLSCLGYGEYRARAYDEALMHLAEGLALAEQPMQPRFVCNILRNMAFVRVARGEAAQACAVICRALRVAQSLNSDSQKARTMLGAVLLGLHMGAHEQAARWAGVIRDDPDADAALLDPACAELEAALGARRFQRALAQGRSMGLDTAVDDILAALGG